ncbi:MAG: ArnT family glycosyltransferase [Candidatus Kapaibacterium sp.]
MFENPKWIFITLVIALALCRFIGLGEAEMQPWDEAMYAVRADAVRTNGAMLDQTEYSVGGLYTGAHPPLTIWLMAAAMDIGDGGAFAARFWPALFGAGLVILMYIMSGGGRRGFFAALALGLMPLFFEYSQMAQLDVPTAFFIYLSIYFWQKNESLRAWKFPIFSGIAFGLALMSKIIVGVFAPISIFLYLMIKRYIIKENFGGDIKRFAIMAAIGLALAAPWHIYMFAEHGRDFLNYFLGYHILDRMGGGVEGNVRWLGAWFYVNQLIVLASVMLAPALFRLREAGRDKETALHFSILIIPLIIFSISATQMRHYSIMMLPAVALLSGAGLDELWRSERRRPWLIALAAIFGYWAISQDMRDTFESALRNFYFSEDLLYIVLGGIAFGALGWFVGSKSKGHTAATLIALAFVVRFPWQYDMPEYDTRIGDIAAKFERAGCRQLVYIDSANGSDVVNPQIYWYFASLRPGINSDREMIYHEAAGSFAGDTLEMREGLVLAARSAVKIFTPAVREYLDQRASDIFIGEKYFAWYMDCGSD